MDLSVTRVTEELRDDLSWLGSAHGTQATQTITLDVTKFTDDHKSDGGSLLSGLPLAVTGTDQGQDLYGLWTVGATLAGFLYKGVRTAEGQTRAGAAILEHGRVKVDNLPVTVDAAGQTSAAGRIIFA